jgi:hypothetical protein
MGAKPPLPVHDVQLAMIAPVVVSNQGSDHIFSGHPGSEQGQAPGAVMGIGERLRRDGSSPGLDMGNQRAHGKVLAGNDDPNAPSRCVASDD